ncbi:MAG: hypothetical protein Q9M48_03545 [Rhodobacterales bacterium]|nr:hypothetical protein [Rhodobacterales bacterium]
MNDKDMLNILEDSLLNTVGETLESEGSETETLVDRFVSLFELVKDDCVLSSLPYFKKEAPTALKNSRKEARGFEKRSFKRWEPSFDHLQMMWAIAQELGEMHGRAVKAGGEEDSNPVMTALSQLFPRALLVTQEIIHLLTRIIHEAA